MDMDMKLIGKRIKGARTAKGLTQEKLAEQIGFVGADSIGHIECGRNRPSLQTMIRIASALEVSLDYLVGLTDTPSAVVASTVAQKEALTDAQSSMLYEIAESMIPFVKRFRN